MNLRDLDYIVAIVRHGSLARAAEACHVSASTLSIQLGKLEAELGARLFERGRRRATPTAIGQNVVAIADSVLRQTRLLKTLARDSQSPYGGLLTLGIFPTLAPYYLPKAVPVLRKAFPDLALRLVEEKTPRLLEKLRRHELDAALLALPVAEPDLASAVLFEDPFFLACPAAHPLAKRRAVRADDLRQETLLLLEDGHCLRDQALEVCHARRAHEEQEFRATSLETLRHMVAAGAGITLMPGLACLPTPGLAYVPFPARERPSRRIGLVWRRESARLKLMEAMAERLRRKS